MSFSLAEGNAFDKVLGLALAIFLMKRLLRNAIRNSANFTCNVGSSFNSKSSYAKLARFVILTANPTKASSLFCIILIKAQAALIEFANSLYWVDNCSDSSSQEICGYSLRYSPIQSDALPS